MDKKKRENTILLSEKYEYFNSKDSHDQIYIKATTSDKKIFAKTNQKLDKYYTKLNIAKNCITDLKNIIPNIHEYLLIEPSAGAGVFLQALEDNSISSKLGFDIAPTKESDFTIIKNDFLHDELTIHLTKEQVKENKIIIGNPPFGKKSDLAIQFINKAFTYSSVVAFIVPIQFNKWSAQSKIDSRAKLIFDKILPDNSFEFLGKDYNVRCSFQIWVIDDNNQFISFPNLRIKDRPILSHPDFEMYQYNRTEIAEKYFDYDWDFAVPRQGYLDYSFKAFSKEQCNKKRQWIFFKAKNKEILKRLLNLDFVKLSLNNTGMPGFGKADVIKEYSSLYKN